jgi:nucleoside-diphosphate-sugar epimerase
MNCLIIGCGYLGSRVADRWLAFGHDVTALTRSPEKAKRLGERGIVPIVADVTDGVSLRNLPAADVLLYAVAYDSSSGDRRTVTLGGLHNVVAAVAGKCARIVFISTSSVYGQSAGEWVDEDSETRPVTEAGQIALEAEHAIREHREFESVILRLTGLYGPDRLLRRVDQLRSGEPIAGDGHAWLNLVHVDDAASAVGCAVAIMMQNSAPSRTEFCITDDRPVRRTEYYGHLARLAGAAPPRFDVSLNARISGVGKRCRNEAAKRELGLTLRYPTYIEGLSNCLSSGSGSVKKL